MSGLEIILGLAALLIGLTGAWSPCGFSMVETIGPSGHTGGRRVTAAALATFVPGALAGGVATYGALSWLGDLVHGAGGRLAYGAAAAIAIAAAVAEARSVPIVPQIRRQLPEHWRRVMPMPVAAGLYGVLLGLGFTTFVLSFGVWALAGISLALGDPTAGIVVGLGFGAGRAIPVLALAPICQRPSGIRATELMTQHPALYRGARRGDAIALIATAVALMVSPAGAATSVVSGAADPSARGDDLVFEKVDGTAELQRANGERLDLPGTDPTLGGPYIGVREKGALVLLDRRTLKQAARVSAPGADALAVSATWLIYRARANGTDVLHARTIGTGNVGGVSTRVPALPDAASAAPDPSALAAGRLVFGPDTVVARADAPASLGRPSLDRDALVYSRATLTSNAINERDLASSRHRTLVASRHWLFSAPSILGGSFSYLRTTNERQEVRIRALGGHGLGRVLYSTPGTSFRDADHGPGHQRLPTRIPPPDRQRTKTEIAGSALAPDRVYLTLLIQRGGVVDARIAGIPR